MYYMYLVLKYIIENSIKEMEKATAVAVGQRKIVIKREKEKDTELPKQFDMNFLRDKHKYEKNYIYTYIHICIYIYIEM